MINKHLFISYVNCDPRQHWVSELNKQLLLSPYGNGADCSVVGGLLSTLSACPYQQSAFDSRKREDGSGESNCEGILSLNALNGSSAKGHRRTMSDIPQFDVDGESMDSYSLDTSMDAEVIEVVISLNII